MRQSGGIWRRSVVVGAALAVLFGVVGVPKGWAQDLERTKIRLGYMPIAEETPKFVAYELALFKKRGLEVEMVRFESGPDMGTALLGGSIQVGMIGTPGMINAAVAGRPLIYLYDNGTNVKGPQGHEYFTGLVVLEGSPIKDIGDLKGKKVALNVLKTNSEVQTVMQVERWNREHPDRKIDLTNDVRFTTMPFGSMLAALERGLVDAASLLEPYTTQMLSRHKIRIISPVSYALEDWPVSLGVARRDFAENHVNTLKAYKATWFEAVRWIRENSAEAKKIMSKYTGMPADVASRSVLPTWGEDLQSVRDRSSKIMDAMVRNKMLPKAIDLSTVIIEDPSTLKPKR